MYCRRCGSIFQTNFANKATTIYCRACLPYQQPQAMISSAITPKTPRISLPYQLTQEQRTLAYALLRQAGPIYVRAVCGAGKTEMVFPSIYQALRQGKRVGIAIPRKEVVKELYMRIRVIFQEVKVIAVYGGHDQDLDGDIVILTTHQTYRYPQKFGLLIVDEYDAFPFQNNQVLQHFTKQSCYGKSIYLSATFQDDEIKNKTYFELNRRFHQHPLPLPKILCFSRLRMVYHLYRYLRSYRDSRYLFVYVPTKRVGKQLSKLLSMVQLPHIFFSSLSKKEVFQEIAKGKHRIVITTTILERGITMANLHVVVYQADHFIFDFKTLVQIAGRVGRKAHSPSGDIYFYVKKKSKVHDRVIAYIQQINEAVSTV